MLLAQVIGLDNIHLYSPKHGTQLNTPTKNQLLIVSKPSTTTDATQLERMFSHNTLTTAEHLRRILLFKVQHNS